MKKIWKRIKELNRRLTELTCMTKGHKWVRVGDFGKISKVCQWQYKRCKIAKVVDKGDFPDDYKL